jgi:hypothetical protein
VSLPLKKRISETALETGPLFLHQLFCALPRLNALPKYHVTRRLPLSVTGLYALSASPTREPRP